MGTNRRYAAQIDARMDQRILERMAKEFPLQTLTDAELALHIDPVTIDPRPKPVKAWVRFGPHSTVVDAVAMRWTSRAVGISFIAGEKELRAWVWMSAVMTLEEYAARHRAPARNDERPPLPPPRRETTAGVERR